MYLKKIEAQGFKSFANKSVMEFTPGIMGIVGPNGSGKSNVADAVRWVLGEQSAKQLRGSNMQDVIFAGTENRKPMGYAYVALTIDNSDKILPVEYEDVCISRQVFRSGESEYRINGNICRLKDVYELFYDTGIGKEGYSIIGQGQIDKILSSKPEERREMFDEAAGIVKYKKRKAVTQKKLEDEQQNLIRVSDILGELEKQVGPLERQSEKAKRYLKLRDELKKYEIGAFYLESDELQSKAETAGNSLQIINQDLAQDNAKAEQLKERYETLSQSVRDLEAGMEDKRNHLAEMRVTKEKLEGRIHILEEQIRTIRANETHYQTRMDVLTKEMSEKNEEKQNFQNQKGELNRTLDSMDDKITRMEERQADYEDEVRAVEFEIEKKNKQMIDAADQKASVHGGAQGLDTRMEQLLLRRSELHQLLIKAKAGQDEETAVLDTRKQKLEELEAELIHQKTVLQQSSAELQKKEEDFREYLRSSNQLNQQKQIMKSKMDSLVNMTERYEGYGNSIRKVMECRSRMPGLVGVVADLIQVDKRYETAVETALGGRIQNVVTDTEQTARKAIEYLKSNKLGRVTFLPISSVSGREGFPRAEALKEDGAVGIASELVKTEKEYKGIVNFLLGRVLVAEDMQKALVIARKYQYTLSIVTLEGEYLSPGGAISGGSYKNNSNLLGRRREIEELEAGIKKAETAFREMEEKRIAADQAIQNLRNEIEKLRNMMEKERLQQTTLTMEIHQRREAAGRWKSQCRDYEDETERIRQNIEELEKGKKEIQKKAEQIDKEQQAFRKDIERLNQKKEKKRAEKEEKAKALEALRMEFSNLNQKNEFLLENIRRIGQEIDKLRSEAEELKAGFGSGTESVQDKETEIQEVRKTIDAGVSQIESLQKELEGEQEVREKQLKEQQGFFEAREELTMHITRLDKEAVRLQSQVERFQEQLEKHIEYLWAEYEMTPTQAEEARDESITSLQEARRFISQRKNEIRELGPVNVNAIEEYKEVAERYEFLKVQHEDLIKAEASLKSIIAELDTGMRRQFEEKFQEIKKEFDIVFRELFGGGKGTLELQEGQDILEAGISIIAQPPGKKLQNMMQLSGGEKALSAIALLFAIQNLKPSPFCLLDEIEAALDEPNVDRFASYLEKLKGTTQFLVITHRRGTMEMADRLYGVTMQEKGVSVLVSVTLTEAEAKAM